MTGLENFFKSISDFIWGNWLMGVLIGVGAYFTIMTRFIQIRKLPYVFKETLIKPLKSEDEKRGVGTLTPFQALCTALSSCVGNGNIIGVATAIVGGGPGAVMWMWIAGILGMATKYAEIVLGMHYRKQADDGTYVGGPMYYIAKGLKLPWLATAYAVFMVLQICGGNLIQSNAVALVMKNSIGLKPVATGFIMIAFLGLIIIGGIHRLGAVAEKMVMFMASFYLIGGIVVILFNGQNLTHAFALIFQGAFSAKAGIAGLAGHSVRQAMRYGIARGLYSNEAGEGSAPVLHASAITDHPVRQALYGITEVMIDTVFICSISALIIVSSGVYATDVSPASMVAMAFSQVHPWLKSVVDISMILFAFSSIMAQWYFGVAGVTYVFNAKVASYFKYPFMCFTLLGCVSSLPLVWYVQDTLLGFLVIPNLIAIIVLSPKVFQLTKEFFDPANGYVKEK